MPVTSRITHHEPPPQQWGQVNSWVDQMLARPSAEADAWALPSLAELSALISSAGDCAAAGQRQAEEAIHLALARLYDLVLKIPPCDRKGPRGSAALEFARAALERAALQGWRELGVGEPGVGELPRDPAEFVKTLAEVAYSHPVASHSFYASHLARRGTRADLRHYFIQELTVDGRFDDLIALFQIGASGSMKMELARNYWDEMGCGSLEDVHTDLFARVIDALAITPEEIARSTTHESRMCGNFSVMLASRRDLFYQAAGYFGIMEFLVPRRMREVLTCWERNALDPEAVKYHRVHMAVDDRHATGWFKHVIEPVLVENPAAGAEIMAGALLRLNTSQQYLDRLLSTVEA